MEMDPGDLCAASLYAAQSTMFDFMLGVLQAALSNERKAGYTATGAQLEPPIAHVVRPALEKFLRARWTVSQEMEMTPEQAKEADEIYQQHLLELQERVLAVTHPFEI